MNKGGKSSAALTLELARRMRHYGIVPEFSFVLGCPPDPENDVARTFDFIRRIKQINPATEIVLYTYTPVPLDGSLYTEAKRLGFAFPETLEQWASPAWEQLSMRRGDGIPWMNAPGGGIRRRVRNFERVINAYYPTVTDCEAHPLAPCRAPRGERVALRPEVVRRALRAARAAAPDALPAAGNDRVLTVVLSPHAAYELWADTYPAVAHNPLMRIEQESVEPLLAHLSRDARARRRLGLRPLPAAARIDRRVDRAGPRLLARDADPQRRPRQRLRRRLPPAVPQRVVRSGQRLADGRRRRRPRAAGRARWRACSPPAGTSSTPTSTPHGRSAAGAAPSAPPMGRNTTCRSTRTRSTIT